MGWIAILTACGVRPETAARWAPVFDAEVQPGTFSSGDAELDDFLAQVCHESAHLERLEEALSYSAQRLCAVWPKRFPTLAAAVPFARNPQKLASHVYADRLGNGSPATGDGWRFRGRGLIQVTGRANYRVVGQALGMDLEADPDLLLRPAIALRASIAWWERNVPDGIMGDTARITRVVNGGQHGLEERMRLAQAAQAAIGGEA